MLTLTINKLQWTEMEQKEPLWNLWLIVIHIFLIGFWNQETCTKNSGEGVHNQTKETNIHENLVIIDNSTKIQDPVEVTNY